MVRRPTCIVLVIGVSTLIACNRNADERPSMPATIAELTELATRDPAAIGTLIANAYRSPRPTPDSISVATAMAVPIVIVFIDGNPDAGPAPLTVKFSVTKADGEPETYRWDFGDGSPVSDQKHPKHVYEKPGRYTARLKVTGRDGTNDEDTVRIDVEEPRTAPPTPQAAPK